MSTPPAASADLDARSWIDILSFVSFTHCWRTPVRSLALVLIVALGLVAGAVTSAHADRWPADLWERLDRERF